MRTIEERTKVSRIHELPEPRHLFVLPAWLDSKALDRLIDQGYVTCAHQQRSETGALQVAMGLKLTSKGKKLLQPESEWHKLAWKGALAGMSLTGMSLLILYLA